MKKIFRKRDSKKAKIEKLQTDIDKLRSVYFWRRHIDLMKNILILWHIYLMENILIKSIIGRSSREQSIKKSV